jgi:UDP-N-acetylglucosamine 2-epimerase (non-hydrolysing)
VRVLVLFGTRPEAIKMAPVISMLKKTQGISPIVCFTGQHREMALSVMEVFGIAPDIDLNLMKPGQTLEGLTADLMTALQPVFDEYNPQMVLVQGDTTTAMVGALAAFYRNVPIGHVEAGLRTGDMKQPWPEEANRRIIGLLAQRHYTPTNLATDNLLREGISSSDIVETGNPVVDALLFIRNRLHSEESLRQKMAEVFQWISPKKKLVLVTGHRRESFGKGFEEICLAIREIADRTDAEIVYPVHLNPNVREPVNRILDSASNVRLLEPLAYDEFIYLMDKCDLILTDSGGIQEEAPSFGKPVLIMRETSERREAIDAGVARLVGANAERIVSEALRLLSDASAYGDMARVHNPFGDGTASLQIAEDILRYASVS